ncbi:MAG: BREX system ATP-binding domain-containing protein [Bacillota bacterium]|jgi:hypothetical protein
MDFEAQRVIEALRSGISSRAVGQYFSSTRMDLINQVAQSLERVRDTERSEGMAVLGRYGEGKTHLLNTVFNLAHSNNMVVSLVSLSKETPFDKLYLVYQKIVANTYLPQHLQPGFQPVFQDITPNSPVAQELLAFTSQHLETDKLFYVWRSYLNVEDPEEKYLLLADLEGDFIATARLKQIYKRIFSQPVKFKASFAKTKHSFEYLVMLSHLFRVLGFNGWVILFDEAELIGKLGSKARLKAYQNMASFLFGSRYSRLESTFALFTFTSSFIQDVIVSKHDFENAAAAFVDRTEREPVENVLKFIQAAPQLSPLTPSEILLILEQVKDFHGRAYDWKPEVDMQEVLRMTANRGDRLRTKIRTAVELLDQLYQYGQAENIGVGNLCELNYREEEIPSLDECI